MGKIKNKIYTVCYDDLDVFKSKEAAKKFYTTCYYSSEGAEQERYASILVDLNFNNIGKDGISTTCNTIHVMNYNNDQPLKIKLDKHLSIEDSIKYYETKINPILDLSKEYDIDFNSRTPFEYFDCDNNYGTMYSFAEYYEKLLKTFGVEFDNIMIKEKSDGKYEMKLDNQILDIRAWDKIESVLDNVNTLLELDKDNEICM